MQAARAAYANRRTIYRAATTVQRAFRTARRNRAQNARRRNPNTPQAARMRIGTPVGTCTSRRRETVRLLPAGQKSDRTLYAYDVTAIPQGTGQDERDRDLLNFRGIKICWDVINTTDPIRPVFVNYAVVSPKNQAFIDESQFWRSNATNQALRWDEPTLSSMDYHCRAINTDKYNVLTHKRFILAPVDSNGQWAGTCNRRVMRYVKVKRQVRYNLFSNGEDPPTNVEKCTTPIFFIWWCCREGYGGETDAADAVVCDLRVVSYFRNPRN